MVYPWPNRLFRCWMLPMHLNCPFTIITRRVQRASHSSILNINIYKFVPKTHYTFLVHITKIQKILWRPPGNVYPFHATVLLLYPLKTIENPRFSDGFRGYRMKSITKWCNESLDKRLRRIFVTPFCNWFYSIAPENSRKPAVFCFQMVWTE